MEHLYRKKSIEKLSSPEQLDKLIVITPPSVWVTVIGMFIVIVAVTVWGIWGSLPTYVDITGIMSENSSTVGVYSLSSGKISLQKEQGAVVTEGEVLAIIDDSMTQEKITQLEQDKKEIEAISLLSTGDVSNQATASLLDIKMQIEQQGFTSADITIQLAEYEKLKTDTKNQLKDLESKYNLLKDEFKTVMGYDISGIQGSVLVLETQIGKLEENLTANMELLNIARTEVSLALTDAGCTLYLDATQTYPADAIELWLQEQSTPSALEIELPAEGQEAEEPVAPSFDISAITQLHLNTKTTEEQYATAANTIAVAKQELINYKTSVDYDNKKKYFDGVWIASTEAELMEISADINFLKQKISSTEDTIYNLGVQEKVLESDKGTQTEILKEKFEKTKESILASVQEQLDVLYPQKERNVITAPCDGVVSLVLLTEGQVVAPGTEVLKVTSSDNVTAGELSVVCYVPITEVKKLKSGMDVLVIPSSVDQNVEGHMKGKIKSVSEFTATTADMTERLGDSLLVGTLQQQGAVTEVVISLTTDSDSDNGYLWSSEKGKSVVLSHGTLSGVKVVTEENAPITKLIPYVKDALEIDEEEE